MDFRESEKFLRTSVFRLGEEGDNLVFVSKLLVLHIFFLFRLNLISFDISRKIERKKSG